MSNQRSFAFLQPGTMLGKYEIKSLLGRGAMAEVYRALNPALNSDVAIKVMSPSVMENKESAARFRREAQAAARLTHPNIIRVYDFDIEGDVYYMVMELLEGHTLSDFIREHTAGLPTGEALRIFTQIAEATHSAHQQGIIHRDIKPTNVILVRDRAVLSDFGLARISDQAQLTATGSSAGTPAYMSPEQASGGEITTRSDIYSLGITLYEMLTGQVPFKGETYASLLLQQIQAQPPMPSSIKEDLDPVHEAVIMRALSKNPEERYATAQEMLNELKSDSVDKLPDATTIFRTPRESSQASRGDATIQLSHGSGSQAIPGDGSTILTAADRQRQRVLIGSITTVAILLGIILLFMVVMGGNGGNGNSDDSAALDAEPPTAPEGMVYVPGATFEMGSARGEENEAPPHTVTVSEFFIDETEVTNADYFEFVNQTGFMEPSTWLRPGTSAWQIESEGVYVVGNFNEQWSYDGELVEFYPDGGFNIDLNADEETGMVIAEFIGTMRPNNSFTFENVRIRVEHTVFEQTAFFHEGGVGDHVLMHGTSGQEADFLPEIISPLSTWGDADIFVSQDLESDNPDFAPVARDVGAHLMLMPGVRDEQGRILRADGSCCFDRSNPDDGLVDEENLEVMLLLFQGADTSYGSSVPGVPGGIGGPSIWLNLYSENLTINEQPETTLARFREGEDDFPVTGVTWSAARAYCEWAGKRLPTEAQWELAAGGLQEFNYPWGDERVVDGEVPANTSAGVLMPVGEFPAGASPYGALDMAGNAWEWVADWYDPDYYAESVGAVDPIGPPGGEEKVLRGGGPAQRDITGSTEFRTTARLTDDPETPGSVYGFRCASPVSTTEDTDS
jgi:serine/threonine protein kinase